MGRRLSVRYKSGLRSSRQQPARRDILRAERRLRLRTAVLPFVKREDNQRSEVETARRMCKCSGPVCILSRQELSSRVRLLFRRCWFTRIDKKCVFGGSAWIHEKNDRTRLQDRSDAERRKAPGLYYRLSAKRRYKWQAMRHSQVR